MPAFVGAIKINAVSSSAVFHIGDTYYIQPISSAKTYAGGGSFNTGDGIRIQLDHSNTIVYDQDQID